MRALIVAAIGVVLVGCGRKDEPVGAPTPPPEAARPDGALSLTISLGQRSVRSGEAAALTITYANSGDAPVTLYANGLAEAGWFAGESLLVVHKGESNRYTFHAADPLPHTPTIKPGEKWTRTIADLATATRYGDVVLDGGTRNYLHSFRDAGEYWLQLHYEPAAPRVGDYYKGSLTSQSVTLSVE